MQLLSILVGFFRGAFNTDLILVGDDIVCDFASSHWLPSNLLDRPPDALLHALLEGSPEGSLGGCFLVGLHNDPFGRSYHFPPESLPDPPGTKKD